MPLLTINNLKVGYGGPLLLDGVSCVIDEGQHIGLLGRNGAGKTTLMRVLTGQIEPDDGEVALAPGARIARLRQDVPADLTGRIDEVVAAGWQPHEHDAEQPWKRDAAIDRVLSAMELPAEARVETLSSGMKRRVLLAQALVSSPDLLLLDEPTNHLDVEAIEWLESFLARWKQTLLFVTHDRAFLRKLADRILEIDRGRLFDWSCDYDTFVVRKEQALAAEEQQNSLFDKRLAEEEAWIRTGIKARRTRNEGRVRALEAMRKERSERRAKLGRATLDIQEAARSGALVAEVKQVSFAYDQRPIFENFSTTIIRGDRIGILGPNGAGKSTLLKVLLGQLQPIAGTVRTGTNLQIAYFDQLRMQLDEDKTIAENVGEGSDRVAIGEKSKHIYGYLQDFLFTPERARTPVRFLSGGERNRVLLAKLFSKPANVIVLDEPTNDLDAETLEMLEERLGAFQGTVLLVSHDRAFLDNVVSSVIVFEPEGLNEYVGGYSDWKRVRDERRRTNRQCEKTAKATESAIETKTAANGNAERKLSYRQRQELKTLPATIEKLESIIANLHAEMSQDDFYKQSEDEIVAKNQELTARQDELDNTFARWEELENRESEIGSRESERGNWTR